MLCHQKGEMDMARIKKVGHVVLGVRDPARSIKFYTEALGMELVNVLDEMQMAFFSFGERDHDIAVIKVPDEQPVGSSGLAHTALEIEGARGSFGGCTSGSSAVAPAWSSPPTTSSPRASISSTRTATAWRSSPSNCPAPAPRKTS